MDPMRRRLTVSADDRTQQAGGQGKGGGASREDIIKTLGLEEVFRSARQASDRKAIAVLTVTDSERERKHPFGDKEEVFCVAEEGSEEQTKLWLQSTVGWTCNKGLKPEACNQDCLSILVVEQNFALYGVYDGHGPYGHDISEFVCRELPKLFLEELQSGKLPPEAFTRSFRGIQQVIEERKWHTRDLPAMSGTTVTLAYHDMSVDKLWIAHVGDSRAIIGSADGKQCDALCVDHKPDLESERRRIESSNPPGRVVFDGYFNYRVFAKDAAVPGLNMSRALGDLVGHKRAGLSAEPDIAEIDLRSTPLGGTGDRVLLLCTDGVWEFIDNEQALQECLGAAAKAPPESSATAGIKTVSKLGYDLWLKDSENELSDDITGIMVRLPRFSGISEGSPAAASGSR